MFGKESGVSPLELRKQLLIAESDINRACLLAEWRALTDEVGGVAARAKSFKGLAASILSLVAAVGTFTNAAPAPAAAKSSLLQRISSSVKLASTVWLMFRSRGSGSEK